MKTIRYFRTSDLSDFTEFPGLYRFQKKMYLIRTPWLLKKLYPGLVWNLNENTKSIYLTFDDGPIPEVTPFVLAALKQYNAKATFFCIGDNVRKYPELFKKVKDEGHAIGNHTFNHLRGWDTGDQVYLDNFLKADELIGSTLFRPPYGRIKRSQVKLLQEAKPGLKIIMWNVLSEDFDVNLKPEKCLDNVIRHTKADDIVLFHDSLKAKERMEYALPKALEHWSNEGYAFKSIWRYSVKDLAGKMSKQSPEEIDKQLDNLRNKWD